MSTKTVTAKPLEVQEAVKKSITAFSSVFPNEVEHDLRLEEVELSDNETEWKITVSFRSKDADVEAQQKAAAQANLSAIFGRPTVVSSRTYKRVTIRSRDGKLIGITNAG